MATLTANLVLAKTKLDSLDAVRKLNLWGADLADLSLVVEIPHLEVLSLSVNRVASLDYVCDCTNLQELYLRKNEIASFDEVRKLSRLKNLKTLWLADNPVAALPQYRYKVLQFCPKLEVLDTVEVTAQERAEAAKLPGLPPSSSTSSSTPPPVSRPAPVVQAPRQSEPPAASRVRTPPPSDQSQRNILSAIVALLGELTPQSLGMLKEEVDGKLRSSR